MNSNITVTGFDELRSKIKELANDKDKKKEVLLILRQVARPTLQAAKNSVPVARKSHVARGKKIEPGNLKKSLGLITSKSQNPTILVGPRAKGNNDGWYGHMVHGGHEIFNQRSSVFTRDSKGRFVTNKVANALTAKKAKRRGVISSGRVKGNPFMDVAYAQTRGTVTADAERKVAAFIQRRINRLSN